MAVSEKINLILQKGSCPTCDLSPTRLPEGKAALECRDVHFQYHDGKEAVAGVSFSLQAGEAAALCGPNGSGKTTLLKLLTGLLYAQKGQILVSGRVLEAAEVKQIFRTIGLLFQDSQDQLFCNYVAEDVAFGLKHLGLSEKEIKERVGLALHLTEAEHLAQRPIHHLSGGEMKRVALAGLIAMRSPLLVLDEPTGGLDPAATQHLIELIRHLHRDHGYAFLCVTHEMDLVPLIAERVLVMEDGHLLADGATRTILTNVPLLEKARLNPPAITKYFFERARLEGRSPASWLPLSVEEALAAGTEK